MKKSLIRTAAPLDLTDATSVQKFEIAGTQPTGTDRKIIFEIEDELFRFVNGILDKYIWHGDIDDILTYGNSVGELLELENVNAFAGKKVFPIVALSAPSDADVFPKIKIAVKWQTYNDIYTAYKFTPIFQIPGENPLITSVRKLFTTTGNATEISEVRLKKITGEWTDWQHYLNAENQIATAIQFRTKFVLSTLDETDFASIDKISVNYISDAAKNASDFRTFFTNLQNYDADLKTCYLLVKHSPLDNVDITAAVSLTPISSRVENIQLGVTDGSAQVFYLNLNGKKIAQDSLHVELDGVPTFDFDFNTGNSTLSLQADAGKIVTASCDCFDVENFVLMEREIISAEKTRFTCRATENNLREGVVKFTVTKKSGSVDEFQIGTGDGSKQVFALDYKPLKFNCDVPFKLQGQILQTAAAIDDPINVSYNWKGTLPQIQSFVAGFAV